MKLIHPEQEKVEIRDGKKFITYSDAYEQEISVKCPCCGKEMGFESRDITDHNYSVTELSLTCADCSLSFLDSYDTCEDDYVTYTIEEGFVTFVKSRLELK